MATMLLQGSALTLGENPTRPISRLAAVKGSDTAVRIYPHLSPRRSGLVHRGNKRSANWGLAGHKGGPKAEVGEARVFSEGWLRCKE